MQQMHAAEPGNAGESLLPGRSVPVRNELAAFHQAWSHHRSVITDLSGTSSTSAERLTGRGEDTLEPLASLVFLWFEWLPWKTRSWAPSWKHGTGDLHHRPWGSWRRFLVRYSRIYHAEVSDRFPLLTTSQGICFSEYSGLFSGLHGGGFGLIEKESFHKGFLDINVQF